MPDLLDQRRLDLEAQLKSLPAELDYWEQRTTQRVFEKHHSQVKALAAQMRALNELVRSTWNNANEFVAIQKAQRDCAAVQRVWNYYREKLLMRLDERMGEHLRAADAYVWSCYEPVLRDRRAKNPTLAFREPPLVAFDTAVVPWAQSRRNTEERGHYGSLHDAKKDPMPIAVLGMPWSTAEMLPCLATLAHETGHVIESDFGLSDELETALRAATAGSKLNDGWSHFWRKEIFADLFACYAAGPSFVWSLTEAVPDSPAVVEQRRRPSAIQSDDQWGKYPPATLRILLNVHALRHHGHTAAADAIERYWQADYPKHAMTEFEDEVKIVVSAVYDAAMLPDELNWAKLAAEYNVVYSAVTRQTAELNTKERYSPRTLIAIASDLRRKPPQGADIEAIWGRLRKHIATSRPSGLLAGRTAATGSPTLRTQEIANLIFDD